MSFDTKAESRPSLHVLNLASSNEEADVGYHATFSTAANGRCEPKCMMLQTVQTAAKVIMLWVSLFAILANITKREWRSTSVAI